MRRPSNYYCMKNYWRQSFKIGVQGEMVYFYEVQHGARGYTLSSIVKKPGSRKYSQKFEVKRFDTLRELYGYVESMAENFDPNGYGNFPMVDELKAAIDEMHDYLVWVGTAGTDAGALEEAWPEYFDRWTICWTRPLANPDWVDTPADPDWADGPGEYIKENESKVWAIPAPHEDGAEEIIRV